MLDALTSISLKFDVHEYLHEEQDQINVENVLGKSLQKS